MGIGCRAITVKKREDRARYLRTQAHVISDCWQPHGLWSAVSRCKLFRGFRIRLCRLAISHKETLCSVDADDLPHLVGLMPSIRQQLARINPVWAANVTHEDNRHSFLQYPEDLVAARSFRDCRIHGLILGIRRGSIARFGKVVGISLCSSSRVSLYFEHRSARTTPRLSRQGVISPCCGMNRD